jgi:hypothetical protein
MFVLAYFALRFLILVTLKVCIYINAGFFIWVLSFYVVSMLLIRLIFALIYLFKYYAILRRTVIKETLNE